MGNRIKKAVKTVHERGGVFTFIRAQFSSQISSLADYAVSLTLVNVFGLFFGYATLCGNITGGIVNCIVNYKWTFKAQGQGTKVKHVAIKYLLVWLVNLFLNTQGTILMTVLVSQWLTPENMPALIANNLFLVPKIIVSLIVGFGWNYNMQRLFVYKDRDIKGFFTQKKTETLPREEREEEIGETVPEIKAETMTPKTEKI